MSVYLHLFHGRTSVDEKLNDWGFNGPVIGPLEYVHGTYMCELKVACSYAVALRFFPQDAAQHEKCCDLNGTDYDTWPVETHLNVVEDLVVHQGKYYGDWSVSTSPTG